MENNERPNRWVKCDIEKQYFGEERKSNKAARKYASASDRSKYKKTDKKKLSNQPKEFKGDRNDFKQGRVISITSGGIIVNIDNIIYICQLRGSLKKERTQFKNLVTVGDHVLIEPTGDGEGAIAYVEPRRTVLSRAENLSRRKEQLIASNIDQVIITASVVSPPLKSSLIDRYIIAAQKGGMEPIILINKIDLLESPDVDPSLSESEQNLYQEVLKAYQKANIRIIGVSSQTGEGLDTLRNTMQNKTSVFSGQSGVGKSSLINEITGGSLRIGDMVKKTNKGSHTTTVANLVQLESGGWCIDTPGIKSFGVWDLDKDELEQYFPEIFTCGHQCRFPDCSHVHEEGCAVHDAVEKGEISILRYESYVMLMHSMSENHSRR